MVAKSKALQILLSALHWILGSLKPESVFYTCLLWFPVQNLVPDESTEWIQRICVCSTSANTNIWSSAHIVDAQYLFVEFPANELLVIIKILKFTCSQFLCHFHFCISLSFFLTRTPDEPSSKLLDFIFLRLSYLQVLRGVLLFDKLTVLER